MADTDTTETVEDPRFMAGGRFLGGQDPAYVTDPPGTPLGEEPPEEPSGMAGPLPLAAPPPYVAQAEAEDEPEPAKAAAPPTQFRAPAPAEPKPVADMSREEAAAAARANGLDDSGPVHVLRARLKAAGITNA